MTNKYVRRHVNEEAHSFKSPPVYALFSYLEIVTPLELKFEKSSTSKIKPPKFNYKIILTFGYGSVR